jgi:hypothetical protein
MKYFKIYQFYVNLAHREEAVLVGKEMAASSEEAEQQYVEKEHPNDPESQSFVSGYLHAQQISKESFEDNDQDEIKENRERIARWL